MVDPTITVIEPPTRTTSCGGARSKVRWSAQGTGYIIQHIQIDNGRKNCFTDRILPLEGWSTAEYWECWRVNAGTVKYDGGIKPRWDDCFEIPDQGRTKGTAKIVGEVKFFPNYTLGKEWKKNQVPEAGILRTTTAAPNGWDATGTKSHILESNWMCCRGKETGSVTGNPLETRAQLPRAPARRAAALLTAMPSWSEIGLGDRNARRAIERTAADIGRIDLGAVRSAIRSYLQRECLTDGGPGIGALSRIFVLNRYLFDVPARVPLGKIRIFGGWHGNRSGRAAISPLWPWKTARGQPRLAGTFKGYSGPPYLALAEFDYFRRAYPRRRRLRKSKD